MDCSSFVKNTCLVNVGYRIWNDGIQIITIFENESKNNLRVNNDDQSFQF